MRGFLRRASRVLLLGVGGVLLTLLGVLALLLLALALPFTRDLIVREGVRIANQSLPEYALSLGSLERLSPFGLELRDFQLRDAQGREMVFVTELSLSLAPSALLDKQLHVTAFEAAGLRVHLYPSDEPAEPSEGGFETDYTLQVDDLSLRDVSFETEQAGRAIVVELAVLKARGSYSDAPSLELRELTLRAKLDGEEALSVREAQAAFRANAGGSLALEGTLADATLSLQAELPKLSDLAPWPVRKAKLELGGLTRAGLARLGVADGLGLKVPLSLDVELTRAGEGAASVLQTELALQAGDSKLELTGKLDTQRAELALKLPRVQLAALSSDFPELMLEGVLELEAEHASTPQTGVLRFRGVRVDGASLPNGSLEAALDLPRVELKALRLAGFEQALSVKAAYDTQAGDASADLALRKFHVGAVPLLAKLGLSGIVDGGVQASLRGERLKGKGALTLEDVRFPQGKLSGATLGFTLSGSTRVPEGEFVLVANSLQVADIALDRVSLEAKANQRELAGKLALYGTHTSLSAQVDGSRKPDGSLRLSVDGQGKIRDKRVQFVLRDFESNRRGLSVSELWLVDGKERLYATGALTHNDRVKAELKLEQLVLENWTSLLGVEHGSGTLDAEVKLDGKLSQPRASVLLSGAGLRYQEHPAVDAKVALEADVGQGDVALDVTLSSEALADARAQVRAKLPARERDLVRAFERADYTAELDVRGELTPVFAQLGEPLSALSGNMQLHAQGSGTLEAPQAELRTNVALRAPEAQAPDTLELALWLTPEAGKLEAKFHDDKGLLVQLGGELGFPEDKLKALLDPDLRWEKLPISATAQLERRDLEALSGVSGHFMQLYAPSLPLSAGARLELSGDAPAPTGTLSLHARLRDDGLDERCAPGLGTDVVLDVGLVPDAITVLLSAQSAHAGSLHVEGDSKLVGPLLIAPLASLGSANLLARGDGLQLGALPGMCGFAQGTGKFELTAAALLSAAPRITASFALDEVSVPNAQPLSLSATLRNDASSVSLQGRLTGQGDVSGEFSARVPLSYPPLGVPELVPQGALKAQLNLKNVPLENLLALTPAIGRPSGKLDARLALSGTPEAPEPEGVLELREASLTIAALAQPFRDVRGRFELKQQTLKVRELFARDRDGELSLSGQASLLSDGRGELQLNLDAKKFPLRQQGSVVGELSTKLNVGGKLSQDREIELAARILEGRIWLTGERGIDVQSLDPHPHVRMAEDLRTPAELEAEEASAKKPFVLKRFSLRSERDLWLMHEDFAVQVGVELALTQELAGTKLVGEASLRRGELSLLGKPFRLERGAIRFTGDIPADPELDLKARHELRTGEALLVHVTGRASAPQLNFSGAATNAGEAAYVLSGARSKSNANNQAQNEAAAFAASVTAGLLSVAARREFGDWVPMISIENDERTGSPGRARAGFDASNLIPDWMSGFARGAYVEGIVGGSEATGAKRMGLGVRLELALPRDFITSMGYGPGATWSTDVAWAP